MTQGAPPGFRQTIKAMDQSPHFTPARPATGQYPAAAKPRGDQFSPPEAPPSRRSIGWRRRRSRGLLRPLHLTRWPATLYSSGISPRRSARVSAGSQESRCSLLHYPWLQWVTPLQQVTFTTKSLGGAGGGRSAPQRLCKEPNADSAHLARIEIAAAGVVLLPWLTNRLMVSASSLGNATTISEDFSCSVQTIPN
jgi:hypothetical protein